jgi:hypothetical protein
MTAHTLSAIVAQILREDPTITLGLISPFLPDRKLANEVLELKIHAAMRLLPRPPASPPPHN